MWWRSVNADPMGVDIAKWNLKMGKSCYRPAKSCEYARILLVATTAYPNVCSGTYCNTGIASMINMTYPWVDSSLRIYKKRSVRFCCRTFSYGVPVLVYPVSSFSRVYRLKNSYDTTSGTINCRLTFLAGRGVQKSKRVAEATSTRGSHATVMARDVTAAIAKEAISGSGLRA